MNVLSAKFIGFFVFCLCLGILIGEPLASGFVERMAAPGTPSWVYLQRKDVLIQWLKNEEIEFDESLPVRELRKLGVRHVHEINAAATAPLERELDLSNVEPKATIGRKLFMKHINDIVDLSSPTPEATLQFLIQVKRIYSLQLVSDTELYQCLLFKVGPPVREILLSSVTDKTPFDSVVTEIVTVVCPTRVRERLKRDKVFRFQRPQESVVLYISSVLEHCDVLDINMTDEELICVVLENLAPSARALLPIFHRPATLADLKILARDLDNQANVQKEYVESFSQSSNNKRLLPSNNSTPSVPGTSQQGTAGTSRLWCANCGTRGHATNSCSQPTVDIRARKCFKCGLPGHQARRCQGNGASL